MPRHWERRHRRRHSPLDDDWDSDDERAAEVLRHGMTPGGGGGAEPLGHAIEDIDTHSAMELDAVHSNPGSDDAPSAEAAAAATSAPHRTGYS